MAPAPQLTALQLAVLRVLWRCGEARVSEVHAELARERAIAPTTVATVLKRLAAQGVVAHRSEGRSYVYRARISEREAERDMVDELAERVFAGDVSRLVAQLLDARQVGPGDLERLEALIEAKKRERRKRR